MSHGRGDKSSSIAAEMVNGGRSFETKVDQSVLSETDESIPKPLQSSLAALLARGKTSAAVAFAGQGASCIDELSDIYRDSPVVREWVDAADVLLRDLALERSFRSSGFVDQGLDLLRWVRDESARPTADYLSSSLVSQPLLFITQMARYIAAFNEGLSAAFESGAIKASLGHSQGVMPSVLIAESPRGIVSRKRFLDYVRYMAWQGLHMAESWAKAPETAKQSGTAPMAAISGLTLERLSEGVEAVNRLLDSGTIDGGRESASPGTPIVIALHNTRTRFVVSGPPRALYRLHEWLAARADRETKLRRAGRFAGQIGTFTWEDLPVGGPYHSPAMASGLQSMRQTVREIGFAVEAFDLVIDCISPATGERLNDSSDLTGALVNMQFIEPVRWTRAIRELRRDGELQHILDLGPGDAAARLTRSILKGSGVEVIPLSEPTGRERLFSESSPESIPPIIRYEELAPSLSTSRGALTAENSFTRATGCPPFILGGMTPTTVDVEIVAAAANAGFVAELAGGGQVTERTFNLRMEELSETLDPGREIVFNALYLDPYLWDLHIRRRKLVQKARAAGAPIRGLTISAGIPDTDQARALLDELRANDIWLNAFKPGTIAQVQQVGRIAEAAPEHTIFVHVEGGKAGGHHSWEDLDELLLAGYDLLRSRPNVILCAGGGIATEARAVELLTGRWACRYELDPMPVDAVFLGTLAMACKESKASPAVKQALVETPGGESWVLSGESEGGITSGKSQLAADIHYIDNAAARCGRLLDQVAGDADAIAARRDEIVKALDQTAKPFFGDLDRMSWLEVLQRMVSLMAIGSGGRYEDGIWPDAGWRSRVADVLWRAESRLAPAGRTVPSTLGHLDELDDPKAVLDRLVARWPEAAMRRPGPADVHWFIREVCARPGKPVNFVPIIDEDVRRWYKSDSLWLQDEARFEADKVLVLPGPEAVRGITKVDEPVADLLSRFDSALLEDVKASGSRAKALPLPQGLIMDEEPKEVVFRATAGAAPESFIRVVRARCAAPLADFIVAPRFGEGRLSKPNPLPKLIRTLKGARLSVDQAGRSLGYVCPDGLESVTVDLLPSTESGGRDQCIRLTIQMATLPDQAASPPPLVLIWNRHPRSGLFVSNPDDHAESLRDFYHASLFGGPLDAVTPFETAWDRKLVEPARVKDYAALTGLQYSPKAPPDLCFSLVWEPLFRVLSHKEVAGGLSRLVHLRHEFEPGETWPLRVGDKVDVKARLTRIEDRSDGRTLQARSEIHKDGKLAALVLSTFFVREPFGHTRFSVRADEPKRLAFTLSDEAAAEYFSGHDWLSLKPGIKLSAGDRLTMECLLGEIRPRNETARFEAGGRLLRASTNNKEPEILGTIALDTSSRARIHPILAAIEPLGFTPVSEISNGSSSEETKETPPLSLASIDARVPSSMHAFAEAGQDLNPIHYSPVMARFAGLERPIAHGMWTSARLTAFAIEEIAAGDRGRLRKQETEFLAPALPGEPLRLEAVRTGTAAGDLNVTLTAKVRRDDDFVPIARSEARIAAPRTAYVFPGQGIQRSDMGMAGYARSAACREIWDRADAFTRRSLGFSILRIVRDNPSEIVVNGRSLVHPKGVLNLTQFTQVAMAVLAQAQAAELRERGVLAEDAVTCGHSVGEYNALGALLGILPLETLIEVVHQRGLVMHGLVPRNDRGESGYGMGVIRPHYAGLDHEMAVRLVGDIRDSTGAFLQIVNYNVRGRQYSVTGRIEALEKLRHSLEEIAVGGKPPYVEVPGIDVPFHSELLSDGVDAFRDAIDAALPARLPADRLVGRYVPNLLAVPFSLERSFALEIRELTGTRALDEVLDDYDKLARQPDALARTILVELLAWQFASPVRWIETQELLLRSRDEGGLGVERIIEIGVEHQPVLTNMARATLGYLGQADTVEILHAEADLDRVLCLDRDDPTSDGPGDDTTEACPSPSSKPGATREEVAEPSRSANESVIETGAEPDAEPVDHPVSPLDAIRLMMATQARLRLEQIDDDETIDGLFDGVSSRRNQALVDLGAEFNLGTIDGASERPLGVLAADISHRARSWMGPGPFTRGVQDEAIGRVLGRSGLNRKAAQKYLTEKWNLGPGLISSALDLLALESREGTSARGGPLGSLAGLRPAGKAAAYELLDEVCKTLADRNGLPLRKRGSSSNGKQQVVDAAAVEALEERLTGPDGALMRAARDLAGHLGHRLDATAGEAGTSKQESPETRLETWEAEHGPEYERMVRPSFESKRHVAFSSPWAFAQRDIAKLYLDASNDRLSISRLAEETARLAVHSRGRDAERFCSTASWYASLARLDGREELAKALESLASGRLSPAPVPVQATRPRVEIAENGSIRYEERPDPRPDALKSLANEIELSGDALSPDDDRLDSVFREVLASATKHPLDFTGRTALVTGAGPGSIAFELVRHLLRGGARVLLTTSTYNKDRLLSYRRLFQHEASPEAELHVVPFNQASVGDIDALADWVFGEITEQAGATVRTTKRPFAPDILVPFGALKQIGTLDGLSPHTEAAMRAMLLGVERLVGAVASRFARIGIPRSPCHVLLPLSPNHGDFGGDGTYAESKAGLETLLSRWHSEQEAWGNATTICGARIGWVRGTGLMDANDPVAAALEEETGARTFSSAEMGLVLAGLCTDDLRAAASKTPLRADLTGGIGRIANLRATVDRIRSRIDAATTKKRRLAALSSKEAELLDSVNVPRSTVTGSDAWPEAVNPPSLRPWPTSVETPLSETVVIVGAGEVGPFGSARPRFEIETEDSLSSAGVLELAWMTGLVRWEPGPPSGWIDVETEEAVQETEIKARYESTVRKQSGIRFIEPETAGYDPERAPVLAKVWLERDFSFPVTSEQEARSFLQNDPENTRAHYDPQSDRWTVTRLAGTEVRVPREVDFDRSVAGIVPRGFDPARYGVPAEMVETLDRATIFNLISTADAFLSAGLTPEELYTWIHPSRVGNTQGSGIGGMQSLHRLYLDHILGQERQGDILQETLVNVVAAYAVQAFSGSYGPMIHPVGACATANVSIEEAMDKIRVGKADFVIAGGFDDIGKEGALGFADMGATASSSEMQAMGMEPEQMSRANDIRRRGFIEAQGGGTLLLARGDVAARMGLPVLGVLAYSASFGDGIHKSIPAPGMGALACATGGRHSPLGEALARFGLTTDDIAFVSKHDTSTNANDPNESDLHHRIQESLERTPGNPLWVVSQKSLTGHAKGGAAAWQIIGLCQSLAAGIIPGNRNLENVDPAMRSHSHLAFSDDSLRPGPALPLRAGLLTTLGFGHVSGVALVLHPDCFAGLMSPKERESWLRRSSNRREEAERHRAKVWMGEEAAFTKRTHRRFVAPDGSAAQADEEASMLLDPNARFDPARGVFSRAASNTEPSSSTPSGDEVEAKTEAGA